jgi:hypothetical protein
MRIITIYALVTLVDKLVGNDFDFDIFFLFTPSKISYLLYIGYDSDEDFLNDNCISSNQCNSMVPNSVCMRGKCQCPNSNAIVSNGKPFCPLQRSKGDHDEDG